MTLVAGLVVAYGYLMEFFMAWFSAEPAEMRMMLNRATGPYAWAFWIMITCNVLIPQLLWSRRIRGNASALFVLSLVINLGMWLERYVIVITSLHRDYLPSAWGMYAGTIWDWTLFIGSIGTFIFLFLLFIRCLPMISIYEMREFIHQKKILQKESQALRKREEAEEHVPEERLYATVAEFEDAERTVDAAGRSAAWDINEWMPIPPFPLRTGGNPAAGIYENASDSTWRAGWGSGIYWYQWYHRYCLSMNIGGRHATVWLRLFHWHLKFLYCRRTGGGSGIFILNRQLSFIAHS